MAKPPTELRLAVVIPCLDEQEGIGSVVREYAAAFPAARVLVVDNGSVDDTVAVARAAGADVIREPRRGKALAVAAALPVLDEDLVIMVDGDGSYPAEGARRLVAAWGEHPADMITGSRVAAPGAPAFRRFHRLGSAAIATVFRIVFRYTPEDLFSGLRLFTRRFYKNVPLLYRGFELETELTVQAIEKGFRLYDVEVPFRERAHGTSSKLRTVRDGVRILRLLVVLFRDYRPLAFFGIIGSAFFLAGLVAGVVPIVEYYQTGLVGHFPRAILAAGLMNLAFFSLFTGIMLQSALRHRREAYQVELRRFGE